MLVYFVSKGPVAGYLPDGTEVWQVGAQVSKDGGKTVETKVFTFGTEEHAIEFKHDVNYKMEPMKIGEED